MNLNEYKKRYSVDDAAPGWDAIDKALARLYFTQNPMHWGTSLNYHLGGKNPLDGISAYRSQSSGTLHLHFCSYGFSSLYYNEEAVGGEFSQYGFELTFRLAIESDEQNEQKWVCGLMQNLAKYVFSSGKWFSEYLWLPANGPIHAGFDTDIVGLAFAKDSELTPIDTPHGKVEFIQMFGITQNELDLLKNGEKTCQQLLLAHQQENPLLITDLSRKSA